MKIHSKSSKTLNTVIGIDLGERKRAACATSKDGNVLREFTIANSRSRRSAGARALGIIDADSLATTDCPSLSIFLLIGGMAIGALCGAGKIAGVAPFFIDPFKGVLCLFLLELGMVIAWSSEVNVLHGEKFAKES